MLFAFIRLAYIKYHVVHVHVCASCMTLTGIMYYNYTGPLSGSVMCIAFFLHPSFGIIFQHRLSTCCLK